MGNKRLFKRVTASLLALMLLLISVLMEPMSILATDSLESSSVGKQDENSSKYDSSSESYEKGEDSIKKNSDDTSFEPDGESQDDNDSSQMVVSSSEKLQSSSTVESNSSKINELHKITVNFEGENKDKWLCKTYDGQGVSRNGIENGIQIDTTKVEALWIAPVSGYKFVTDEKGKIKIKVSKIKGSNIDVINEDISYCNMKGFSFTYFSYKLPEIDSDITIKIEVLSEIKPIDWNYSKVENCTITKFNNKVDPNKIDKLKIQPDNGYKIDSVNTSTYYTVNSSDDPKTPYAKIIKIKDASLLYNSDIPVKVITSKIKWESIETENCVVTGIVAGTDVFSGNNKKASFRVVPNGAYKIDTEKLAEQLTNNGVKSFVIEPSDSGDGSVNVTIEYKNCHEDINIDVQAIKISKFKRIQITKTEDGKQLGKLIDENGKELSGESEIPYDGDNAVVYFVPNPGYAVDGIIVNGVKNAVVLTNENIIKVGDSKAYEIKIEKNKIHEALTINIPVRKARYNFKSSDDYVVKVNGKSIKTNQEARFSSKIIGAAGSFETFSVELTEDAVKNNTVIENVEINGTEIGCYSWSDIVYQEKSSNYATKRVCNIYKDDFIGDIDVTVTTANVDELDGTPKKSEYGVIEYEEAEIETEKVVSKITVKAQEGYHLVEILSKDDKGGISKITEGLGKNDSVEHSLELKDGKLITLKGGNIVAVFARNKYKIKQSTVSGQNCTVSPLCSDTTYYWYGDTVSITATPNEGYYIKQFDKRTKKGDVFVNEEWFKGNDLTFDADGNASISFEANSDLTFMVETQKISDSKANIGVEVLSCEELIDAGNTEKQNKFAFKSNSDVKIKFSDLNDYKQIVFNNTLYDVDNANCNIIVGEISDKTDVNLFLRNKENVVTKLSLELNPDNESPAFEIEKFPSSEWAKGYAFKANITDSLSGVKTIEYTFDNEITDSTKWLTLNTGVLTDSKYFKIADVELNTVGVKSNAVTVKFTQYNGNFSIRATDRADNTEVKTFEVKTDSNKPAIKVVEGELSADSNSAKWQQTTKFKILADDRQKYDSGIKKVEYSFDGKTYVLLKLEADEKFDYNGTKVAKIESVEYTSGDAKKFNVKFIDNYKGKIYFKTTDNAGNEANMSGYIMNDNTAPVLESKDMPTKETVTWKNKTAFLVLATDRDNYNSGIKTVEYSFVDNDEDYTPFKLEAGEQLKYKETPVAIIKRVDYSSGDAKKFVIEFTANYKGKIYFKITDNAENSRKLTTGYIQNDVTCPKLEGKLIRTYWTNQDGVVKIEFTAKDFDLDANNNIGEGADDNKASGFESFEYYLKSDKYDGVTFMDSWKELSNGSSIALSNDKNNHTIANVTISEESDNSHKLTISFVRNYHGLLYVRAKDEAGNYSVLNEQEIDINNTELGNFIMFDNIHPTLDVEKTAEENSDGWTNKVPSITLTAKDESEDKLVLQSGIKDIQYKIVNSGAEFAGIDQLDSVTTESTMIIFGNNVTEKRKLSFKESFEGDLVFKAVDRAGNCSDEVATKVMFDNESPVFKIEKFPSSEWAKGYDFKANISDNLSRVKTIEYTLDNEITDSTKWLTLNSGSLTDSKYFKIADVELNTDDVKKNNAVTVKFTQYNGKFSIRATDKADNTSEVKTFEVKTDITLPDLKANGLLKDAENAEWQKDTTFAITTTDNKEYDSGIAKVEYSFNGTDYRELALENGEKIKFKVDEFNGYEVAELSIKDDENSVAEKVFTVKFIADYKGEIHFKTTDNAGNDRILDGYIKNDTSRPQLSDFKIIKLDNKGNPMFKENKDDKKKDATKEYDKVDYKSFGVFYNGSLSIEVTVTDDLARFNDTDNSSSGVNSIIMKYGNGEIALKPIKVEKNVYTCKLAPDTVYDNVYFYAVDNVGNNTAVKKNELYGDDEWQDTELKALFKGDDKTTLVNNRIVCDKTEPVINITPVYEGINKKIGNQMWTNEAFTFDISVKDPTAKLAKADYTITNTLEENSVTRKNNFEFKDVDFYYAGEYVNKERITAEGKNTIELTAVDNATNKNDATKNIYIDSTAPHVTSFDFTNATYDHDVAKTDIKGAKGEKIDVKKTNYGYYFKKATTVTVNVKDSGASSGIHSITFERISLDGKVYSEIAEFSLSLKDTESASFNVPAGFKGQIRAYAEDNMERVGATRSPDDLIIETQKQHDAEKNHIVIDKKTSNITSGNNVPLFSSEQSISVSVKDEVSGIRNVHWEISNLVDGVTSKGDINVDNNGKVSGGWKVNAREENLVTKLSHTFIIGDDANENRNDIELKIVLTDRAGYIKEDHYKLSVDKTKPKIDVKYVSDKPNNTAGGKQYFNSNRTATITISERNFDESKVNISVSPTNVARSSWQHYVNSKNPDESRHVMTITYSQDADYSFDISLRDKVGNESLSYKRDQFTIDKTKPIINVSFADNNQVAKGATEGYYNFDRTATIKITEHNFNAAQVEIAMTSTAEDNVTSKANPAVSSWSTVGDVHTATVHFADNGKYSLSVNYTDLATNKATPFDKTEFYVDKIKPTVSFNGDNGKLSIESSHAYSGNIIPHVTASDYNLNLNDDTKFIVTIKRDERASTKITKTNTITQQAASLTPATIHNIYDSFSTTDPEIDGIYDFEVYVMDKAGNVNELDKAKIRFSVNRFGSTYLMASKDSKELVENHYGNNECDVLVWEINPTRISLDGDDQPTVTVTINGSESKTLEINKDFTVVKNSGNDIEENMIPLDKGENRGGTHNGIWNSYLYKINKENFKDDGRFQISISSVDDAKNNNGNNNPIYKADTKVINFVIDKTQPSVTVSGIENGEKSQNANVDLFITCSDLNMPKITDTKNEKLVFATESNKNNTESNFVLLINGKYYDLNDIKKIGEFTQDENSDEISIKLNILGGNKNDTKNVVVMVRDLAGNWSSLEQSINKGNLYTAEKVLKKLNTHDGAIENYNGYVEFTLNATLFTRILANKPVLISIIVGFVVIAGLFILLFRIKRKHNQ